MTNQYFSIKICNGVIMDDLSFDNMLDFAGTGISKVHCEHNCYELTSNPGLRIMTLPKHISLDQIDLIKTALKKTTRNVVITQS